MIHAYVYMCFTYAVVHRTLIFIQRKYCQRRREIHCMYHHEMPSWGHCNILLVHARILVERGNSELANIHWHMYIYMTIVDQPLETHDFPLLSKFKLRSHDISPTKTLEIHMASARPWGCKGSSSFKRAWILTTLLGHHPRAPLEALDHHQSRDPGFDPLGGSKGQFVTREAYL